MRTSDVVAKLADALSKAQGELEHAKKDKKNDHFKSRYADLASVCEVLRPVFPKYGLSVVQVPSMGEHGIVLTTRLLHASGEWIEGTLPLAVKGDGMQAVVSAITYARRASLAAITGVAPDDDDGEAAQGRGDAPRRDNAPPQAARPQAAAPVNGSAQAGTGDDRLISEPQRKRFYAISKGKDWSAEDVTTLLQQHGYATSKDIRVRDYNALVALLEAGTLPEAPRDEDTSEPEYFDSEEAPF